eukprot:6204777-Pleurochrysis_carterae.AAC.2
MHDCCLPCIRAGVSVASCPPQLRYDAHDSKALVRWELRRLADLPAQTLVDSLCLVRQSLRVDKVELLLYLRQRESVLHRCGEHLACCACHSLDAESGWAPKRKRHAYNTLGAADDGFARRGVA